MSITCETQTEVSFSGNTLVVHSTVRRLGMPPLVYVAGPYTKPDPVVNTNRMIHIGDAILDLGVVPIVPHLTMFWHLLCPRPHEHWLDYDRQIMLRCDAVLRVPGESQGADQEVRLAHNMEIPVLHAATDHTDDCAVAVAEWLEDYANEWTERRTY